MSSTTTDIPLEWFDLASESLGGAVLWATDDFFAEKENLLRDTEAVWKEDAYTDRGKWMDGWESRRKRVEGHDWCHVRLGVAGRIHRIVVDTAFFRGNYPESCSLEGCVAASDAKPEELEQADWHEIVAKSKLEGDSKNVFDVDDRRRFTHLRFHIYPDGGVARLRVYGEPIPDPKRIDAEGRIDLASMLNGASTLAQSDMFFGRSQNLLKPWRGVNMGDGWETKRRRGPGHDWVAIRLAAEGTIREVEIDTTHFKGNYPARATVETLLERPVNPPAPSPVLVGDYELMAHTPHIIEVDGEPARYVIFRIYPDGGVSRLRLRGHLTKAGRRAIGLRWVNSLPDDEAYAAMLACCGSKTWAETMVESLPFDDFDQMTAVSERLWQQLDDEDYLEAFAAHPRIGAKKSAGWSANEQAGVASAEERTKSELAELNDAYYEKHGFIFIICATGKSAEEMLDALRERLANDREPEIATAAAEQSKITRLRLAKLLDGES